MSRSGYYKAIRSEKREETGIEKRVVLCFEKHKGRYGRTRIRKALLKELLTPIFERNGVRQTALFGLYAKGIAMPHNDVDILVDSGPRGLAFSGLLEDVASSPEVPVDLLGIRQIDSGFGLDREIRKSGVPTYGRQRLPNPAQAVGAHGGHVAILRGLRLPSLFFGIFGNKAVTC